LRGQAGQPAGQQCATLSVDRTSLFECNEALTVTVNDPKRTGVGSVQVLASSDSDSRPFSTGVVSALHPIKTFTLTETPASSGIFIGSVTVSQALNSPTSLFVSTGDTNIQFYYQDPLCDASGNGVVAQNDFDNLDGDGVAFATDNCKFDYNPTQADADGDGIGNICDNCPGASTPNADQKDSDGDGVGDACDLDDIDFDGIVNARDNCPDVYNPSQQVSSTNATRGSACDSTNTDRDGDGLTDKLDNCVRTYNPSPQIDSDNDGLGDACDGDCVGVVVGDLPATAAEPKPGVCARLNTTLCAVDADCPLSGTCLENPSNVCTVSASRCTCIFTGTCSLDASKACASNADRTGVGTCVNIGKDSCARKGVTNSGSCAAINDDLDVDTVPDALDDCPTVYNAPIIPGTLRQLDTDNDGVGDACDNAAMVDGDNNGIPDDVVSFGLQVNCSRLPLPNIVIEAVTVRDTNGDLDAFCDTGETCEMTVALVNNGPLALNDVILHLATSDPDIACVQIASVDIGSLPVGGRVDTADVGAGHLRLPFRYQVSAPPTPFPRPIRSAYGPRSKPRYATKSRPHIASFQSQVVLPFAQLIRNAKALGSPTSGADSKRSLPRRSKRHVRSWTWPFIYGHPSGSIAQ